MMKKSSLLKTCILAGSVFAILNISGCPNQTGGGGNTPQVPEKITVTVEGDTGYNVKASASFEADKGDTWQKIKAKAEEKVELKANYERAGWKLGSAYLDDGTVFNKSETVTAVSKPQGAPDPVRLTITVTGDEGTEPKTPNTFPADENALWKDIKTVAESKISVKPNYEISEWRLTDKTGELLADDKTFTASATVFAVTKKKVVTPPAPSGNKITIVFDEKEIALASPSFGIDELKSGTEVETGTVLVMEAVNLAAGKTVNRWKINNKEIVEPFYTVNKADAKPENGKYVINITFTVKEKAKLRVRFDSDKIGVQKTGMQSGIPPQPVFDNTELDEGTALLLTAVTLDADKMVDKWSINNKYTPQAQGLVGMPVNMTAYALHSDHAIIEGGEKVIRITFTEKTASLITIKFNESEISVFDVFSGQSPSNDSKVKEGSTLAFAAIAIAPGEKVSKWLVNTKEIDGEPGYYIVNAADAVGGVITITYRKTALEKITIKFDSASIEAKKSERQQGPVIPQPINDGDEVNEGNDLYLQLKDPSSAGEKIAVWKVNGKEIPSDNFYCSYTVKAADAVLNDGKKVITIMCSLKDPENITLEFDSAKVKVMNILDASLVTDGSTVKERTFLKLTALDLPAGHIVKRWLINGKERGNNPDGQYIVELSHAEEKGGKKVIKVTYETGLPGKVTLKFDPSNVEIEKRLGGGTTEAVSDGDEVAEDTEIIMTAKIPTVTRWIVGNMTIKGGKTIGIRIGRFQVENAEIENGKKVIRIRAE